MSLATPDISLLAPVERSERESGLAGAQMQPLWRTLAWACGGALGGEVCSEKATRAADRPAFPEWYIVRSMIHIVAPRGHVESSPVQAIRGSEVTTIYVLALDQCKDQRHICPICRELAVQAGR